MKYTYIDSKFVRLVATNALTSLV